MNSYELLKSEFDVLMIYEDEAEAVATVMLKANFSREVEQWVWCGDSLLKNQMAQTPSPAQAQMYGNPQLGLQGIDPQQLQQMRVTSKPGRFFGLGKPQYEMSGGAYGHSMQGTQPQLARQMQGMAPGSSPVQAYEQQFGALQQGGPGRLKQALGAMGQGARAMGRGAKAGWQVAGKKLDAGAAQVKDAWHGDEDAGRVGVKDWGRKAWGGVKDAAASAVNAAQQFETPEQTAERGYQATRNLPGERVPLPTTLEQGMTPSNVGQPRNVGQGDYTQGQSDGNNLGNVQLNLPGLEPEINVSPHQGSGSQQTSLYDNHPTQAQDTEIPIPIPTPGGAQETTTGDASQTHGWTPEQWGKLSGGVKRAWEGSHANDPELADIIRERMVAGEAYDPEKAGMKGWKGGRWVGAQRALGIDPTAVQTSFDAIDHAWDYLLKGE